MKDTQAKLQRVDKILNTPSPKDRISILEEQIKNVCVHFNQENHRIKEELGALKTAVFNQTLAPKEAAMILKITPGMVRRHLEEGKIEGYREGNRWKTTIEKLFDYMNKKPKKYGQELTLMDVVKYVN